MSVLDSATLDYYGAYEREFESWQRVANAAEALVKRLLMDRNFDLHLVSARAKTPLSLLQKLRRKGYADPKDELTDRVGVRVITYYESDVDPVVAELRQHLTIDEARSEDKRVELALREFGYRSVHLLAKAKLDGLENVDTRALGRDWFEIQVRSVLEHAWAEVEHELVYKAGIDHAGGFRREFSGLAATLELVDGKFEALRGERDRLIEAHASMYAERRELDESLDSARLLGLLECSLPDGKSFRAAEVEGSPFPPRVEAVCVKALEGAGIRTGSELLRHLSSTECIRVRGEYASRHGVAADELSHLAVLTIAIATAVPDEFAEQFPDLAGDPVLRDLRF